MPTNSPDAVKDQVVAGQDLLRQECPSCAKMREKNLALRRRLDKVRRHILNETAEIESLAKEITESAV